MKTDSFASSFASSLLVMTAIVMCAEMLKYIWHFLRLFVTLPLKMANLLRLGKKRNNFLCFALDFS